MQTPNKRSMCLFDFVPTCGVHGIPILNLIKYYESNEIGVYEYLLLFTYYAIQKKNSTKYKNYVINLMSKCNGSN